MSRSHMGWKIFLATFLISAFWVSQFSLKAYAGEYHTTFIGNLAVGGYDPVAYFTMGKAVKGSSKYSLDWKDAKWRFSTQEHMNMFKDNPEKYAPRYGGHCAWAVSEKEVLYRGSPRHWEIIDDKLYLNHSSSINNRWMDDFSSHIKKADENWEQVKEKYRIKEEIKQNKSKR